MRKTLLPIILLFLMASVGYCKDQPLQLTIKSDKQVYEAGEEIKINLTLKNIGKENITVIKRTGYEHTDLIIDGLGRHGRLVQKYGENCPRTTYFYVYPNKNDFLILKPNEHWNATIDVFESIEAEIIKELLKETGKHIISVLYYIDDAQVKNASELGFQLSPLKLVSNAITIEVVEGKAISKEEALKIAQEFIVSKRIDLKKYKYPEIYDTPQYWSIIYVPLKRMAPGDRIIVNVDKKTGEAHISPDE